MNHFQLIKILKQDLKESSVNDFKFNSIKFFRRNFSSYWLWILLLERYFNKDTKAHYVEDILNEIPYKFASRPTLLKIIDNAVAKRFLIKEIDKNDKRKHLIYPSKLTVNEFEEWALIFKYKN